MPAAAITFFITLVLLIGYVAYRIGEEKRGVKLWAKARANADAEIEHAYKSAVMGNLPSNWRIAFVQFTHQISHAVVLLSVEVLRAVERELLKISHRMRRGGVPTGTGKEPSDFLKTITPPTPEKGRGSDLSKGPESVGTE